MYTTVNIHMNTGSISEPHNWRDKDMILAENSHNSGNYIDISNEFDDSFHITLYRSTLIEKYNELFGEALKEYNDKQKRSDRKITMNEYMDSVENDTRGKRQTKLVNGKRVADYSKQKGKRLSYELTTAVGNTECAKGDDKRVCYDKANHQIRPEYLPRDLQYRIVRAYCKSFQERNPYFAVVNIDIHGDELYLNQRNVWEYAVVHAHIEFIPFAEGFKQGLSTQNSMNKALAAMGIEYGKDRRCPYEVWCEKERKYMEELTYKMYEEYCRKNPDFYSENGPLHIYHPVSDRSRIGGLDKENYIAKKELEEQQADMRVALDDVNRRAEEQEIEKRELDERKKDQDNRELSYTSREIGLNAKEEMLKHKAEENKREEEKNKLDAEANEQARKQIEADRASADERNAILIKGFEELEEDKEEFQEYQKRKNEEFDELVEKAADKKVEEILKKMEMERKKVRMGEKTYSGSGDSSQDYYSPKLKKRFK